MAGSTQSGGAGLFLVVGLGNPGRKYLNTRHNIGFMILDRMVQKEGGEFRAEARWKAEFARLSGAGEGIPGRAATLLKPQTFMNLSGESVGAAMRFYKVSAEQILVVYDDVELEPGQLRFRGRGGAGGHNGIKSIIQHLGTEKFPRLKVGVGRAADSRVPLSEHVLGKFSESEREGLENCLDRAAEGVRFALAHGVLEAMNKFNAKPGREPQNKPKDPPDPPNAQASDGG